MIASVFTALVFVAMLGSGIAAGLFFIFSNTIMASFARLPVPQGIAAMQQINVTIITPLFMLVFMGLVVLSLVLGAKAIFGWSEAGAALLLAGSVAYLVGCFLVTMVFNVPLNDALAAVDPASAGRATSRSGCRGTMSARSHAWCRWRRSSWPLPAPHDASARRSGSISGKARCKKQETEIAGDNPAFFLPQAWRFQRATACSISRPTRSG